MRVRHKPWAKDYLANLRFHRHLDSIDSNTFKTLSYTKIAFEVGVGKGDYLKAMVTKFPDVFFLGIELNASVLSVAAQKLEDVEADNFIISNADAMLLLPKIASNSVDYLILNHSDPWPKKRHEKRRLTYRTFMDEYFRILKPGGEILFKSDNDDFAEYSYEVMTSYPFSELTFNKDYKGDALFDALTEYESKFIVKGVKIKRIVGKK